MYAHRWRATRYDIGSRADYLRCILDMAQMDPELSQPIAAHPSQTTAVNGSSSHH